MSPRRAIFFDRDGTLMDEVDYCRDPALVRAIPGAREALIAAREAGWLRIIITNQSGIGSGRISMEEYEAVQTELLHQLDHEIDSVYFCPDPSNAPTRRRKPGPGMIEEAVQAFGLDPSACWMIGDKAIDVECGHNAGCRSALVRTGYGEDAVQAELVVPDVAIAVERILAGSA